MTDNNDMRAIMDQFRRIDAEMGGKNLVKDSIREDVVRYRKVVEGQLSELIDNKAKRESRAQWDKPYGFMRSLTESTFEVASNDEETVGTITASSIEEAQEELGAFADRLGLIAETLFIRGPKA